MPRRRPPRASLLLLVGALLLAACGTEEVPEPLPELTAGTAPTDQQPTVLPAFGPRSMADGEQWPRACALLTDQDVRAVLPQASEVERQGLPWEIDYRVLSRSPGGLPVEVAEDRYARSRLVEVPEQSCHLRIILPAGDGIREPREPPEQSYATVSITVETVGSPDTVQDEWTSQQRGWQQQQPVPDVVGADCVENTGDHRAEEPSHISFACRTEHMMIGLAASFPHGGQVRVAGRADDPDPAVVDEWFRSRVAPQFLGVAVRRMA